MDEMKPAEVKTIAAAALQAACESDPADPEHPDTICITTGDFEAIVRGEIENWLDTRPPVEPVAIVGKDWQLMWASQDTLKSIVERTGVGIGSFLYTHPAPTADVAELVNELERLEAMYSIGGTTLTKAASTITTLTAENARLLRIVEESAACPEGFKPLGLLPTNTASRLVDALTENAALKAKLDATREVLADGYRQASKAPPGVRTIALAATIRNGLDTLAATQGEGG